MGRKISAESNSMRVTICQDNRKHKCNHKDIETHIKRVKNVSNGTSPTVNKRADRRNIYKEGSSQTPTVFWNTQINYDETNL